MSGLPPAIRIDVSGGPICCSSAHRKAPRRVRPALEGSRAHDLGEDLVLADVGKMLLQIARDVRDPERVADSDLRADS